MHAQDFMSPLTRAILALPAHGLLSLPFFCFLSFLSSYCYSDLIECRVDVDQDRTRTAIATIVIRTRATILTNDLHTRRKGNRTLGASYTSTRLRNLLRKRQRGERVIDHNFVIISRLFAILYGSKLNLKIKFRK